MCVYIKSPSYSVCVHLYNICVHNKCGGEYRKHQITNQTIYLIINISTVQLKCKLNNIIDVMYY